MAFTLKSQGCVTAATHNSCNHSVACAEVWLEPICSALQLTAVLRKEDAEVARRFVLGVAPRVIHTPGDQLANAKTETTLFPICHCNT